MDADVSDRSWLHDAFPVPDAGGWYVRCDTCHRTSGPMASRADATLEAAHHIRARRPEGETPPLPLYLFPRQWMP